jgi:hypothetical protein
VPRQFTVGSDRDTRAKPTPVVLESLGYNALDSREGTAHDQPRIGDIVGCGVGRIVGHMAWSIEFRGVA